MVAVWSDYKKNVHVVSSDRVLELKKMRSSLGKLEFTLFLSCLPVTESRCSLQSVQLRCWGTASYWIGSWLQRVFFFYIVPKGRQTARDMQYFLADSTVTGSIAISAPISQGLACYRGLPTEKWDMVLASYGLLTLPQVCSYESATVKSNSTSPPPLYSPVL